MTRSQLPKHLLRSGSVLALVALVSACSSSNNATRNTEETPPPPASFDTLVDAQLGISDTAEQMADAAKMSADKALEDARKAGKGLTAVSTAGVSKTVMDNASMILSSHTAITMAVTNLEKALADANKVKSELAKLTGTTDTEKARLKREQNNIDDLIAAITAQHEAAMKIRDSDEATGIMALAEKVTGDDEDNLMTAAMYANGQAKLVAAALMSPGGAEFDSLDPIQGSAQILLATKGRTALKAALEDENKIVFGRGNTLPEGARTFEQIFDTTTQAIGNVVVPATSLKGKNSTVGGVTLTPTSTDADTTGVDVTYMGIEGRAFCRGTCDVESGSLTGNWFFAPYRSSSRDFNVHDLTKVYFTGNADDGYKPAIYAEYGSWLEMDGGKPVLKRAAGLGSGSVGGFRNESRRFDNRRRSGESDTKTTASYSGKAAGLSARKTFNADGTVNTVTTGHFTADVALSMNIANDDVDFKGKIDNFQSEHGAVNSNWEVTLNPQDTVDVYVGGAGGGKGTVSTAENDSMNTAANSSWTAYGYGPSASGEVNRPEGFYGDFNAHFRDGHAAGVYAVSED